MSNTTNQNRNFHQYFYNKNGRRGVIVARVYPDKTFNVGWSLAATKRGDSYDALMGMEIAMARLDLAESLGVRRRLNDDRTTDMAELRKLVPHTMGDLLTSVFDRIERMCYPKAKPTKVVVSSLEEKVNAHLDNLAAAVGRKVANLNPFSRFQNSSN
jgi:hypothetical protein